MCDERKQASMRADKCGRYDDRHSRLEKTSAGVMGVCLVGLTHMFL